MVPNCICGADIIHCDHQHLHKQLAHAQGGKGAEPWQQCDGNPLTVVCQPTGLTIDNSYHGLDQVDDHNKNTVIT